MLLSIGCCRFVIVEFLVKVKIIVGYFGEGYDVEVSVGYICDFF